MLFQLEFIVKAKPVTNLWWESITVTTTLTSSLWDTANLTQALYVLHISNT